MMDISQILFLQKQSIINWHSDFTLVHKELPWNFIEENSQWNFMLWHEEDIARIKDIDPARIMLAKQNIDRYNQARNNAMEKIDEWVLNYLNLHNTGHCSQLHSETPGMMIDRLSIMQLKHYHMEQETLREDASFEHKEKCANRVAVLEEQIRDLADCLLDVLRKIQDGGLKFKVYRQFKMYNDPSLNPQLYARSVAS